MTLMRIIRALLRAMCSGNRVAPKASQVPAPAPPSGGSDVPRTGLAGSLRLAGSRGRILVGDRVDFVSSPNQGDVFAVGRPDTILIHGTSGGTAAGAITTLTDPVSRDRVSAHVVVDRDGSITQLVPLDTIAWHAGKSSWDGEEYVNSRSIGIELVNWGHLDEVAGQLRSWCETPVSLDEGVFCRHRHHLQALWWHRYTTEQLQAAEELCRLLVDAFPIRWILGHEEVAPDRKTDPGPAFPLDELRARLGLPLEDLSA